MRKKRCNRCGVNRRILIKAEVHEQAKSDDGDMHMFGQKLSWMCVPCLLRSINMGGQDKGKYDHKLAMEHI